MDTTAATTIGATVAVYVQLLKVARPGLEPSRAMLTIILLSCASVAVWVYSQSSVSHIDSSWAFGIFTAVANVSLTAAGTYGLILGGINAVANNRASLVGELPPTDIEPVQPPVNKSAPPPPARPLPNSPTRI